MFVKHKICSVMTEAELYFRKTSLQVKNATSIITYQLWFLHIDSGTLILETYHILPPLASYNFSTI